MAHLFSPQGEGDCKKIGMLLNFGDILDNGGTLTFQRSNLRGIAIKSTYYITVCNLLLQVYLH